jgi:hypothetical protein
MDAMINKVLGIVIGAVLVGALAGTAISAIMNVNKTGWDAATTALYALVGIFVALAFALIFVRMATD